ncbi:cyclin-J18 isoform X1 [Lactuca sativa]|uniref:cyclin-J18 isoform X1 n=2 Tax=Lactuca sativa TaxID=4236 RepID=UPI000CD96CE8|nr:cyclin-J18 isoform X1 [Lactuca sativa]
MTNELCSTVRIRVLDFLIQSAQQLEVPPVVKYSALSLFAERFYPIVSRFEQESTGHWLLQPVRESNLQLFSLIAIWISSKIDDSLPLSVKKLKSLADKIIQEQHYTTRDFAEAEVIFMKVLDYEIGTSDIVFRFLEDLVIQLKEVATVGEHLDFEVCMDIMDLLYEKEETSTLYNSPHSLAASILVASYVITVPKQRWEFPILPWGVRIWICRVTIQILGIQRNKGSWVKRKCLCCKG